jgi:hypothetical protein
LQPTINLIDTMKRSNQPFNPLALFDDLISTSARAVSSKAARNNVPFPRAMLPAERIRANNAGVLPTDSLMTTVFSDEDDLNSMLAPLEKQAEDFKKTNLHDCLSGETKMATTLRTLSKMNLPCRSHHIMSTGLSYTTLSYIANIS